MSPETDLLTRLDHELGGLPAVPAEAYLREGRRARRRRTATVALAAPVAAAAAIALAVSLGTGGQGREASLAQEPTAPPKVEQPVVDDGYDPDFVAPEPNNPLEAQDGLDGIDSFTTKEIPSWAQEYGHHGPVGLTADGRLWVAPGAIVRRVVVDPYGKDVPGISASFAVEAQCGCNLPTTPGEEPDPDKVVWVILSTDGTGVGGGTMDDPGRWTDDFELWVDDNTSLEQGRPSFAERLVRFDGEDLVPASPGVEVVRQTADTGYPASFASRTAAATVTYGGSTWYVMAADPRGEGEGPWYAAADGDTAPDLAAYVEAWHNQ